MCARRGKSVCMAKTKKTKTIALKTSSDSDRAAAFRRCMIHLSAAVMLLGAIVLGVAIDRRYVEQKLVPATEPAKVVLKNRPVWMSDFLAEQIERTAKPHGTHSAFDHQLLVDTVALLRANPWIQEVRQVRRAYGQKPGDTI